MEELHESVMGRLTSGLSESLLCDILTLFDKHTLLNLECMDQESQSRMTALLQRYYKDADSMKVKTE